VSLRPFARSLVAASLAFALVAAAASGTAFSVNSVQGIPVAAAASGTFDTEPCTGSYDITWTVSSGNIVGVSAIRIPPSTVSDPGLKYCADMPYAILIADRADVEIVPGVFDFSRPDWTVEWTGITDSVTGSIDASSTAPTSGPLQLSVGTAVQLAIGPDPLDLPAPTFTGGGPGGPPPGGDPGGAGGAFPTLICNDYATGGVAQVVTVASDDYCVHTFDTWSLFETFTETFEVVAVEPLDVEYLVVGGGGGGGASLGGGGGAGGVLTNVGASPLTLDPGDEFTVIVGAFGRGAQTAGVRGDDGQDSQFGAFVAKGGGGGGSLGASTGSGGGSGGGGSFRSSGGEPETDQGRGGGTGARSGAGGGGGADLLLFPPLGLGADGQDSGPTGGKGGEGITSSITGAALLYAAGGGGGSQGGTAGSGGGGGDPRGGGDGSATCSFGGTSFLTGLTGSGGGGGGLSVGIDPQAGGTEDCPGGPGSAGVVIVRYRVPSA